MTLFFFISETHVITIQSGVGNDSQERNKKRLIFSLVIIYYPVIITKGMCLSKLEVQNMFRTSNLSLLLLWSVWTYILYNIVAGNIGTFAFLQRSLSFHTRPQQWKIQQKWLSRA